MNTSTRVTLHDSHVRYRTALIDHYRDINNDHNWWDAVYEDAKNTADLLGIDIYDISFSGFWSQGDGASFTGSYFYMPKVLETIRRERPTDKALHDIARRLHHAQRINFYRVSVRITRSHQAVHSFAMSCNAEDTKQSGRHVANEDAFTDALRAYADWIYDQLEQEYEWLTSDEAVIDTVNANEMYLDFQPEDAYN